ncbi:MAG TPA: cation transporter, partial [Ktedonobacteraceae bacterium]
MATSTERNQEENKATLSDQTSEISRAVLAIEGMTCASCAMRIEKGLKKVAGVIDANVNLATEKAAVIYDPAQTNLEQMVEKVEIVGYKATPQVASLQLPAHETASSEITETYGTHIVSIPQE